MRALIPIAALALSCGTACHADAKKPPLKVSSDGFPSGHGSPEGVACDLARAFIKRDAALFKSTCLNNMAVGKGYDKFMKAMIKSFGEEKKRKTPSPTAPKSLAKAFAARRLSKDGPYSYAYAVYGFSDLKFVDIGVTLADGRHILNRTFVIQESNGKWYVDPAPQLNPMLSGSLNDETPSTKDFKDAYTVTK